MANERVGVIGQTNASENGIYDVKDSAAWVRSSDCDGTPDGEVTSGICFSVREGTLYAGWGCILITKDPIVIGTTDLEFTDWEPSDAASGRFIDKVIINVTTAFDATSPTIDIGISGDTDKYVDQTEVDLTTIGIYSIDVASYVSGSEEILATFGAGAAGSVGIAEITLIESFPLVTT